MDRFRRLGALTGSGNVAEEASNFDAFDFSKAKPAHVYEGTDSEDDEIITSRGVRIGVQEEGPKIEVYGGWIGDISQTLRYPDDPVDPSVPSNSAHAKVEGKYTNTEDNIGQVGESPVGNLQDFFPEYLQFELGEVAEEGDAFCPLMAIKKYPYTFIGETNRQKVAESFFDQNKLVDKNAWDLFYIHRSTSAFQNQPIILVPTKQFVNFLITINKKLNTRLAIPSGEASSGFHFTFIHDGTPQPRYLGRSTSGEMADQLKMNVPPNSYRIKGEPDSIAPDDRSLDAFRKKIDLMLQAQKGKKAANKEKQKVGRIAKQHEWCNSIKRIQRYIGLRETRHQLHGSIKAILGSTGLQFANSEAAAKAAAAQLPPTAFNANKLAPFVLEGGVVFISIDVEAYERDSNKITEIGVASLDTKDIAGLVPGEGGANWFSVIRSRHFRIKEYKHLNNTEFVDGCADRFEFGTSEFISLKDAAHTVECCFEPPYSKPLQFAPTGEDSVTRNVVLVGHDLSADVNFLRTFGHDVYNTENLIEQVDTASMWRYCTRDTNPRNLGSILAELGIMGWNLHNAGNDATYTLQAMIAISIKHIVDSEKARTVKDAEKLKRISETVAEATANAVEREQGWSSGGSDGGDPVAPVAPPLPKGAKRVVVSQPWGQSSNSFSKAAASRYMDSPWRSEKRPKRWAGDGEFDKWGATATQAASMTQRVGTAPATAQRVVGPSAAPAAAASVFADDRNVGRYLAATVTQNSGAPPATSGQWSVGPSAPSSVAGELGKIDSSMKEIKLSEPQKAEYSACAASLYPQAPTKGPKGLTIDIEAASQYPGGIRGQLAYIQDPATGFISDNLTALRLPGGSGMVNQAPSNRRPIATSFDTMSQAYRRMAVNRGPPNTSAVDDNAELVNTDDASNSSSASTNGNCGSGRLATNQTHPDFSGWGRN